jgi:cytochrome c oxidase subunit 3
MAPISTNNPIGEETEVKSGGFGGPPWGDNGGGSSDDGILAPFQEEPKSAERIKLVVWFLLLVVLMTFAGIIAAYVMVSTNQALEWRPFQLPVQIWLSTGLLFGSSFAYEVSHRLRLSGRQMGSRNWLLVTGVLGAVFIASQVLAWVSLYNQGLYLQSNPYAGFFYFLTVLHAIHVIGGVVALGYLLLRAWYPTMDDEELIARNAWSKGVGLYWHCMDGLWIVLVMLLAFWK